MSRSSDSGDGGIGSGGGGGGERKEETRVECFIYLACLPAVTGRGRRRPRFAMGRITIAGQTS